MITIDMELDVILDGMRESEHSEIVDELRQRHGSSFILNELDTDMIYEYLDRDEVIEHYGFKTDVSSIDEQMDDLYFKLDDEQKKILLLRVFKDLL